MEEEEKWVGGTYCVCGSEIDAHAARLGGEKHDKEGRIRLLKLIDLLFVCLGWVGGLGGGGGGGSNELLN